MSIPMVPALVTTSGTPYNPSSLPPETEIAARVSRLPFGFILQVYTPRVGCLVNSIHLQRSLFSGTLIYVPRHKRSLPSLLIPADSQSETVEAVRHQVGRIPPLSQGRKSAQRNRSAARYLKD